MCWPSEIRKCVQELSPVNARGTLICKINISDSPLSLPFPGVSSLTWTVGENRAVLFFARELLTW
jgi:hypothetical protein